MSQILIEKDNTLEFSDIVIPLFYPGEDEVPDNNVQADNKSGVQQTKVYGVLSPIIEINDVCIDFSDIISFNLKSIGQLPEISLSVIDRYNLLSSLATPGADNSMQICIVPPIEDAYKKIKLKFYISNYRQSGEYINLTGIYKVPELYSSRYQSLGQMTTRDLFIWASNETKMGFATNIKENNYDTRWIYCNDKSILELLQDQIKMSGDSSGRVVMDFWVDFWNNLTLCDIYDRWNIKDKEEDMMIWTTGQIGEVDPKVKIEPIHLQTNLNNLFVARYTELYVLDYKIKNQTGSGVSKGTDKCYSTWKDSQEEWRDNLIQDSDVKQDVYTKYEYLGEDWGDGDFNYMLAPYIRDAFLQKVNSQTLEITLQTPVLGIMRGDQVLFNWYINDSMYNWGKEGMEESDVIKSEPLDEIEEASKNSNSDGKYILNNKISGQYTVIGQVIEYEPDGGWKYKLTLTRPQSDIPAIINKPIATNEN